MPTLTSRPTFPLVPSGSQIDHIFPIDSAVSNDLVTLSEQHIWILDFTNGGKTPGVVTSQTRMRDIELVINPLSGMDSMGSVNMLSFGTGSWVDLLVCIILPNCFIIICNCVNFFEAEIWCNCFSRAIYGSICLLTP